MVIKILLHAGITFQFSNTLTVHEKFPSVYNCSKNLCFNPFIYFFAIQLLMLSNPIVPSKSSLIHVWHCITDHILVPLYLGFRLSKLKRLRRRRRRRFSQLRDKVFKVFHLKKSEIRKAKEFEKMLQPKN